MPRSRNILPALAFVAVTGTTFSAYAGPCTAQKPPQFRMISHLHGYRYRWINIGALQ